MSHYIYTITNLINYKVYVGQTSNPKHRWASHKYEANRNVLQYTLYKALRKYGFDVFQFNLIEICKTQEEADSAEKYWIEQFDSRNNQMGYNLSVGGSVSSGWHHSEETKQKLREMFSGRGPAYTMTDEIRNKMSESQKGHQVSDETIQKISQSHQGKILSEEHKEKLSQAHLGKTRTEEVKIKMSKASLGKSKSEEHVNNISKSKTGDKHPMFGKKQSQETINKKRASLMKLTPEQVEYIKTQLQSNVRGVASQLAKMFNVSLTTICNIRDGKAHK